MRALLTFGSLLIVLAVVALSVKSQLQANKRFLASAPAPAPAASGAASAPFEGSSSPSVAQFQRELDKTLRETARHRDDQAASAGEDGTR